MTHGRLMKTSRKWNRYKVLNLSSDHNCLSKNYFTLSHHPLSRPSDQKEGRPFGGSLDV